MLSTVVLLCGLAVAAPAHAAPSNDGTVTAEYSGS